MKPQPESSTQEVLAGLVERVTFHNVENGFCVWTPTVIVFEHPHFRCPMPA
jgi:hypothetical protein